ncbi:MAG: hypothetical protein NTU89_00685, partial [Candidatus Dependentiae bacterium]|nr:hypothetical protein [Candidatus Dependentiae bacterium]
MKSNLKLSLLLSVVLIQSIIESSVERQDKKVATLSCTDLSAMPSQESFHLSPSKTPFGKSFGGISSGFNSPEQALNARVPFKNEQGEEPCVRIKTPCSLVGDGKI